MWNERYAEEGFAYGTEPNDFLRDVAASIPPGPVLCLAEGEGRNAVYLAGLGHDVTALDASEVGMRKAARLASDRGLAVRTIVADLAAFELGEACWSGLVSIFAHVPSALRRSLHAAAVRALAPGGVLVLEAYTPSQIALGTGGPRDPDMMPRLAMLRDELAGLEFAVARELERDVVEGRYHTGRAAVVQLVARKPMG